jgi:hypothetical protein
MIRGLINHAYYIMEQINYSELFIDGEQIRARRGNAILKPHNVGNLVLPTGRIVACDPLAFHEVSPFTVGVLPNEYPVILSLANFDKEQIVAYAMLKFSDEKPVRWEMPALTNSQGTSLDEDEATYVVDSGTGCFMDVEAAQILVEDQDDDQKDDTYSSKVLDEMNKSRNSNLSWANISLNPTTKANIICFSTGVGDGFYTSYFGFGAKGDAVCVVTDFDVFDDEELVEYFV